MTNLEYFRDWFEANKDDVFTESFGLSKKTNAPVLCSKLDCCDCLFRDRDERISVDVDDCRIARRKWLNQEHADIPGIDLSKLKVDDKILVSNDGKKWRKVHFAAIDDFTGNPRAWINGGTSWTEITTSCWRYAKLPEEDNK